MTNDETTENIDGEAVGQLAFFEAGKTYSTDLDPYKASEQNTVFVCSGIAVHPVTGDRFAFGFARSGGQPEDDWNLVLLGQQAWDQGWSEGDRWAAGA